MKFKPGDWVLWAGNECISDYGDPVRIVLCYDRNGCVVTVRPTTEQQTMAPLDRFPEEALSLQLEAQLQRDADIEEYRVRVRELCDVLNKKEDEAKSFRKQEGVVADAIRRCCDRRNHLVKKLLGAVEELTKLDLEDKPLVREEA